MLVSPYPTRGCWQVHSAVVTKVAGRALDIAQGNCWAQSSAAGRRCQKDRNAPADTWPFFVCSPLSARLCLFTNNSGRLSLSRRQSHNQPDSLLNATPLASRRDSVSSSWLQRSVLVSGECVENLGLCAWDPNHQPSNLRNTFPTAQTSASPPLFSSSRPGFSFSMTFVLPVLWARLQLSFLSSPFVPARLHTRFVAYTSSHRVQIFCQALGRGFDGIFQRTPNTGPSLHRAKRGEKKQTPETHSTDRTHGGFALFRPTPRLSSAVCSLYRATIFSCLNHSRVWPR